MRRFGESRRKLQLLLKRLIWYGDQKRSRGIAVDIVGRKIQCISVLGEGKTGDIQKHFGIKVPPRHFFHIGRRRIHDGGGVSDKVLKGEAFAGLPVKYIVIGPVVAVRCISIILIMITAKGDRLVIHIVQVGVERSLPDI